MKVYTLNGVPIPLSRPRFSFITKTVYDPQKQEKLLASITLKSQHDEEPLLFGPLHLTATFFMPIPIKGPRKGMPSKNGTPHPIKPDLSNLVKFCEDVAVGSIIRDDSYVSSITASKLYDHNPRTEFSFKMLLPPTSRIASHLLKKQTIKNKAKNDSKEKSRQKD